MITKKHQHCEICSLLFIMSYSLCGNRVKNSNAFLCCVLFVMGSTCFHLRLRSHRWSTTIVFTDHHKYKGFPKFTVVKYCSFGLIKQTKIVLCNSQVLCTFWHSHTLNWDWFVFNLLYFLHFYIYKIPRGPFQCVYKTVVLNCMD